MSASVSLSLISTTGTAAGTHTHTYTAVTEQYRQQTCAAARPRYHDDRLSASRRLRAECWCCRQPHAVSAEQSHTSAWCRPDEAGPTCLHPAPSHNVTAVTTTVSHTYTQPFHGPFLPEENFWTLWCKERLTEADTPTIRLGTTPSGLISAHLHHHPINNISSY